MRKYDQEGSMEPWTRGKYATTTSREVRNYDLEGSTQLWIRGKYATKTMKYARMTSRDGCMSSREVLN